MRLIFDHFVLDCEQRVLLRKEDVVPLSPKVFETLRMLALSGGRVITKKEFMEVLWPESFVEDSNLTQNIFVLRKVLGVTNEGRAFIETVPKRGYRFIADVRREETTGTLEPPEASWPTIQIQTATAETDSTADGSGREESPAVISPILSSRERAAGRLAIRWGVAGLMIPTALLLILSGYFVRHSQARLRVSGYQRLTNDGNSKDLLTTVSPIVPSGTDIYFTELSGNRSVLARVPFEGGEVAYGSTPSANYHLIGSQPGGRALMFGANWPADINYPLLSKDLVTDRFARVFNINAQDGSWSPDGKAFAYAQVENLYVRAADGSTSLVASVKGVAYWLRWSPDGSKIRFSESSQGFHDRMWEVNSAGGQLHQILLSRGDTDHICCGSWTADGRGFVYLSVGANNSSIHVRSENESSWGRWTGSTIDIPAAPLDKWIAPVPSPDGKHVFVIGEQLHGKLVRINPATREPEPFVSGISAEGLSFSPDQADVAWTAYPEGTLWRSQSDGSNRVQLTQSPLIARFPRWSPDGRTIVFTGARPGSDWQLYTVPANGGKVKPVLFEAASQGVATWSPDGKSLVFGHLVNSGTEKNRHLDIQIVRLADGKTTLLAGSAGLWTARWSPDGQFISAVTEDGHTLKLYDVRERVWSDLAHGNINDVVWSPDSRSLFFDTGLGAQPAVYRVRLMDGKLETWATLPNFRRAGFFAPWLGMGPDGAPILLEDAGVQELYSVAVNLP